MDAALNGNIITIMRFVEEGIVDVNAKDDYEWTALMYAAQNGHLGLTEYLIFWQKNMNI